MAAALGPVVDSKAAQAIDGSKADLSSLRGVQLAISVTGFVTTEQKLNDQQSAAQVTPKLVVIADTHAWHFQAVSFARDKLGSIVERSYASKPEVNEVEHDGGREITWSAADGRKAVAFVVGSIVYFSNDRESLEKTLAVRSGAANFASPAKMDPPTDVLAAGYLSKAGVAQLSDIVGMRVAASGSDDAQVRSTVASILPSLIREMVSDVRWRASKGETGVIDTFDINMPEEVRAALGASSATELHQRLGNAVLGLLRDSKLDEKTRSEAATVIASAAEPTERTQTTFTPTGVQRTSSSEAGLIGDIIAQFTGR